MKKRKEEQEKKSQELKQKVVKMRVLVFLHFCVEITSRYDELHQSAELIMDRLQAKHCVANYTVTSTKSILRCIINNDARVTSAKGILRCIINNDARDKFCKKY